MQCTSSTRWPCVLRRTVQLLHADCPHMHVVCLLACLQQDLFPLVQGPLGNMNKCNHLSRHTVYMWVYIYVCVCIIGVRIMCMSVCVSRATSPYAKPWCIMAAVQCSAILKHDQSSSGHHAPDACPAHELHSHHAASTASCRCMPASVQVTGAGECSDPRSMACCMVNLSLTTLTSNNPGCFARFPCCLSRLLLDPPELAFAYGLIH